MLDGVSLHLNADGLLADLPGWSFMDWVDGWDNGVAPKGEDNAGSIVNLLYCLALRKAAVAESALGERHLEARWNEMADALSARIFGRYYREGRGLLADDDGNEKFSEHAQCLALLSDAVPAGEGKGVFQALVSDSGLVRSSVYFSRYFFETCFMFSRADIFLRRLDLWRGYVADGLKTVLESPGAAARSDCHAWGAHPLHFFHSGLAGVRPDSPFFRTVRVEPSSGGLSRIDSVTPHPKGKIRVSLDFSGGRPKGFVELPPAVTGWFFSVPLVPGRNEIP